MHTGLVSLIARLIAQKTSEPTTDEVPESVIVQGGQSQKPKHVVSADANYWLTPVKGDDMQTAEEVLQTLLGEESIYAFGEKTPGRKRLKVGDRMCYYAAGKGVVAHAKVGSVPQKHLHPKVRHSDKYPWVFKVEDVELYLDEPIPVDAEMRSHLGAFKGRDPNKAWAWFVQATSRLTEQDFHALTQG